MSNSNLTSIIENGKNENITAFPQKCQKVGDNVSGFLQLKPS